MNKVVGPNWLYSAEIGNSSPSPTNEALSPKRWNELEEIGLGWKLHLNFDAENSETVHDVHNYLTDLEEERQISTFKIGQGGGNAAGAPGKEATVYVGPRNKANKVAANIENGLASQLLEPEGDALLSDIPFTPKVMGRFCITLDSRDFHQYGGRGIPFLDRDMDPWNGRDRNTAYNAADTILRARYGSYYTG